MEQTEMIRTSQIWDVQSFVFRRGCKMCIQAESGHGKSSLLSFIFGNRRDYEGQILYNDVDIRTFSIDKWCQLRQRSIALLPQEMRLFPELTVIENIELKNQLTRFFSLPQIETLLDRLGIAEKRNELVGKLSIGQQQRVAIVRTLCQPFDFVMLDEPVSHLDERNNLLVAQIVEEEAARQGAGIISTSVGNHLMLDNAEMVRL